MNIAAHV